MNPDPAPDYPAAHSMDTNWFAVDRDGHVGMFVTLEMGALPGALEMGADGGDVLSRLVEVAPRSMPLFDLASWIGEGPDRKEQHVPLDGSHVNWDVLFLDSVEPIQELIAQRKVIAVACRSGVAVFPRDFVDEEIRRLHAAGLCRSCFELLQYYEDMAVLLGLFCFEHSDACENWIAGPYGSIRTPKEPLRIDQLPPDLRDAIGRVRLGGSSFAETESIQPIEQVPCGIMNEDAGYVAADGITIRAFPGKGEEFRLRNKDYLSGQARPFGPYRYEPPPEAGRP